MTAEAPWTEWVTRQMGDGLPDEWTLACSHGAVTSEQVKQHIAPDVALGLFVVERDQHPDLSGDELTMIVARRLLGQLLNERAGCSCAERPFAVAHDDDERYWIEDVT